MRKRRTSNSLTLTVVRFKRLPANLIPTTPSAKPPVCLIGAWLGRQLLKALSCLGQDFHLGQTWH